MDQKTIVLLVVGALVVYAMANQDSEGDDENLVDEVMNKIDEGVAIVTGPGPLQNMSTSPGGKRMIRNSESCSLTAYDLGDGGITIGWGHQYTRFEIPKQSILQEEADAMFENDVVTRGESKVKLYVMVPLTQYQFDAMVDISYGLSVKGFKKFAASVNAGNGIDGIARESVAWVADVYKRGIGLRRDRQMSLYNEGFYS
jgi:lysozyme